MVATKYGAKQHGNLISGQTVLKDNACPDVGQTLPSNSDEIMAVYSIFIPDPRLLYIVLSQL